MTPLTLEQILDPANQGKVACRVCEGCGKVVDFFFLVNLARCEAYLAHYNPNEIRDKAILGECICPQLVVEAMKDFERINRLLNLHPLKSDNSPSVRLLAIEVEESLKRLEGL